MKKRTTEKQLYDKNTKEPAHVRKKRTTEKKLYDKDSTLKQIPITPRPSSSHLGKH